MFDLDIQEPRGLYFHAPGFTLFIRRGSIFINKRPFSIKGFGIKYLGKPHTPSPDA